MFNELTRRAILGVGATSCAAVAAAAALTRQGRQQQPSQGPRLEPGTGRIPVAFIMDDGATMIDFAGPWEVFQDAGVADVPGFELYTVARHRDPMQTTGNMSASGMSGLKFTADHTFADAPQPRVIVMGAQQAGTNAAKLEWIRAAAEKADVVMSVCTGAFILARTGLIDGRKATTHHDFFDSFAREFPKVELVRGRRFVDNGKFVSAGGLTSGIDAALHVITRYYGMEAATKVADYMEYQSKGWVA